MYFVRHGESEANLLGLWAGSEDSPLTELGIKQALETGNSLLNLKINKIISSPLIRAHHTAIKIAEVINFDTNLIELDSRIVEYDLGIFSGKPKKVLTANIIRNDLSVEIPENFRKRVINFLQDISFKDHSQLLVVAHAGIQRMIEIVKQKRDPAEFLELPPMKNAEYLEYDLSFLKEI